MSETGLTIIAVYNLDPGAGNDPTRKGYLSFDYGSATKEAISDEQLAAIVADRLGLAGNIPDPSLFSARFPDDTLVAVVDPITDPYTHFVINTTGSTPNGGGTPGALTLIADDWDVHFYSLFISNDDQASYTQILGATSDPANDGNGNLQLSASDTTKPPAISDFALADPALTYAFTGVVDSGSGLIAVPYRLQDTDTGLPITDYFSALTGDFSAFLPVRTEPYNLVIEAWDAFNNVSLSNVQSVTVSAAGGLSVGWENPSETFNEADGTVTINILIPGGSDGAGSVTVSTQADTATDDTADPTYGQYEVLATASQAIGDTVASIAVSLVLVDTGAVFDNNKLFLYIDHGSGDSDGYTITREVCIIYIDSSSSGGLIGYQPKAVTPFDITFDIPDTNVVYTNSIASGQEADQYSISPSVGTRARDGEWVDAATSENDYSGSNIDFEAPKFEALIAITQAMIDETTGNMFTLAMRTKVSSVARRMHFEFPRSILSVGDHDSGTGGAGFRLVTLDQDHGYVDTTNEGKKVFIAGVTGLTDGMHDVTDATGAVLDVPNAGTDAAIGDTGAFVSGDSTLQEFESPSAGSIHWSWEQAQATSGDTIDFFCDTAGTYTIRGRMVNAVYGLDAITIWPQGVTFDPNTTAAGTSSDGGDDGFGEIQSTYLTTAGGTSGNPDTDTDTYYPEPVTAAPAATVTPDGTVPVTTSPVVIVSWPSNFSVLEVNEFTVTNPGGTEQSFSSKTIGTFAMEIRPIGLIEGIEYTITYKGRIINENGGARNINDTATFTTIDSTTNADLLYESDTPLAALKSQIPLQVTQTIWEQIFGDTNSTVINPGQMFIVEDPADGPTADPVMRVDFREGAIGLSVGRGGAPSGVQGNVARGIGGNELLTEEYVSYEIYIPSTNIMPKQMKGLRSISQIHTTGSNNEIDSNLACEAGISGNNSWMTTNGIPIHNIYGPDPTQYLVISRGATGQATRTWWPNSDAADPPSGLSPPSDRTYYGPPRDTWFQIERHTKLNDTPGVANGEFHMWINGILRCSKEDYVWRIESVTDRTDGWKKFNFITWLGGNTDDIFRCPKDQSIYWRKVYVSKERITG